MPEDSANLARLFNKLDRGDGIELTLIVVATIVLIRIAQRTLPWVANRLHGRPRHYLLASVPLLRLLLIGVALALMLPILIEPRCRTWWRCWAPPAWRSASPSRTTSAA